MSPVTSHQSPVSDAEPLIRVQGVSKKFCLSLKKSLWYGLCDMGRELTGRRHGIAHPVSSSQSQVSSLKSPVSDSALRPKEFWAVHDVSFELKRGECLGLIGRNGAGKTTLLKMLNGLIKPDAGRIEMRGRVGALISLGAGFNGVLTGRENIYTNASILGLSKKETDAKLDEIIEFAEIGEFIDTPVQNYSSGMAVRLGFAIAAVMIKPDILLLDEVLAVGDMGFVIKCLNTVQSMMANTAVVFVSHNMQFVSSFCTRVVVMQAGGSLLDTSDVSAGVDLYLSLFPSGSIVAGTGEAQIENIRLLAGQKEQGQDKEVAIAAGETLGVCFDVVVPPGFSEPLELFFQINDSGLGALVSFDRTVSASSGAQLVPGRNHVRASFGAVDFNAGRYSLVVAVLGGNPRRALARIQGVGRFRVTANHVHWGRFVRPVEVTVQAHN